MRKLLIIVTAWMMTAGSLPSFCQSVYAEEETPEDVSAETPADNAIEEDPDGEAAAETVTDETDAEEITYPAFSDTVTVDGIAVSVTAEEGVFPDGSCLFAQSIPAGEQQSVDETLENTRAADVNVAASYTFDIKVLDRDGNEVQPADEQTVNVAFTLAEAADTNLEANVYHVVDGEAEALETSSEGNTVSAEADGFSYYTVEFTYGTLQYSLAGSESVELDTILNALGLSGEVTDAVSSAPELFSAENTDGTWKIVSRQSFASEETLTVTIGGIEYVIQVTDPAEVYPVWFSGEQITSETCDDVYHDGGSVKYDPLTQTMTFDHPKLTHKMPFAEEALIIVDGITLTITGYAVFDDYFITEDGISLKNGADLIFKDAYVVFDDPTRPISALIGSDITLYDSYLAAYGANYEGIFCSELVVNNSTVIATGFNYGLLSFRGITVNSGYVQATATKITQGDFEINGGIMDTPLIVEEGDIFLNGGAMTAYAEDAWWVYGYRYGLEADTGTIHISKDMNYVIADGEMAVSYLYPLDLNPALSIRDPIGYTLVNGEPPWYDQLTCIGNPSGTAPAKHVEIAPPSSLRVEFHNNGYGIKVKPQYVKPGQNVVKPADLSEKGYTFGGWYTEPECTNLYDFSAPVYTNIDLYAKWYADVTVEFDMQGHGYGPAPQILSYGGIPAEPSEPSADGYTFDGWYAEPECSNLYDFSKPVTEDTIVYAKFVKDPVVTFDVLGHGTAPASQTVRYGETAEVPEDPAEEGYYFVSWFTDSACTVQYDFSDPVTADMTLYAKWLIRVTGMNLHADGTKKDGTYYILNTDVLEPVFPAETAEVKMTLGHLCTDNGCTDAITSAPVKGTTYYFRVDMDDLSFLDQGIQLILFDPVIADNISASAEDAVIEFDWLKGSPGGDSVTIQLKYTESEIIYTVGKGADAEWTKGSSAGMDYTVSRSLSDAKTFGLFESIEVDGKVLAASDYTASAGSLNASLKPSYLNGLKDGVHTVKFNFRDGSAETDLTIKSVPATPPTGDHTGPWAGFLFLSVLVFASGAALRRRLDF